MLYEVSSIRKRQLLWAHVIVDERTIIKRSNTILKRWITPSPIRREVKEISQEHVIWLAS
jgi:hypothetical protein